MRVLALDIGEKRIGVAISDPSGAVATPLCVIDVVSHARDAQRIAALVDEYEAERIVVGLPLSLDGAEGRQARHVRARVQKLGGELGAPIDFVDERLSSVEANRRMAETGASERDRRGSVDMVAAAVFLQSYLDEMRPDPLGE